MAHCFDPVKTLDEITSHSKTFQCAARRMQPHGPQKPAKDADNSGKSAFSAASKCICCVKSGRKFSGGPVELCTAQSLV